MAMQLEVLPPASQRIMTKIKALVIPLHYHCLIAMLKPRASLQGIMIAFNKHHILTMNPAEELPHILVLQMQAKVPDMPKHVLLPHRCIDRINHASIHLLNLVHPKRPLAEIKDIPMIKMCIRSEKDHSLIPCLAL
jgi:hypothetical protein